MARRSNKEGLMAGWVDGLFLERTLREVGTALRGEPAYEELLSRPRPESPEMDLLVAYFQYRLWCVTHPPDYYHHATTNLSPWIIPRGEYRHHCRDARVWLFEDFSNEPFSCSWCLDHINSALGADITQEDLIARFKEYQKSDQSELDLAG